MKRKPKEKKIRRFAEGTKVPVDRTRPEIERLVRDHKATSFGSMWDKDSFVVMFELRGKRLRFDVRAPETKKYPLQRDWEAEERRRWRALLLILKAKLEMVESGDAEFESEFLANFVLKNGSTIATNFLPNLRAILDTSSMPKLLAAGEP